MKPWPTDTSHANPIRNPRTQICANQGWEDPVAQVVCRQLGFIGGTALKSNQTDSSTRRTEWLQADKFICNGNEVNLDACRIERRSYEIIGFCAPANIRCRLKVFNSVEVRREGMDGKNLMAVTSKRDSWFICQRQDEMPFVSQAHVWQVQFFTAQMYYYFISKSKIVMLS